MNKTTFEPQKILFPMPVSLVVTGTPENPGSYMAEAMDPLIYMGGAREYRKLGEKIGDAYSVGRNLG